MPYYTNRRRFGRRRRYRRFRWGALPWRRARRYWWKRRRRRLQWVRRKLRLLKRLRYRARRFRALRYRRKRKRLIGPYAVRYFIPPVRRNCTITGWLPLMYFNKNQITLPFYDPTSETFMGGGITMMDLTLNMLYDKYLLGQCRWSKSNYGFPFGRFRGGYVKLFRTNNFSYQFKYWQGHNITKNLTWMDLHPADLLLQKERRIVSCNMAIPYRKRHTTKKVKIPIPDSMSSEWYDSCDLGAHVICRLGASLIDFNQPFQNTQDPSGNYYVSVGFETPDRRTLVNYNGATQTDGIKYTTDALSLWPRSWVTWGGPINTWLPPGQRTWWCNNKYGELCTTDPPAPLGGPDFVNLPPECRNKPQNGPNYLIRWYDVNSGLMPLVSRKHMAYFCKTTEPPLPAGHERFPVDPDFDGFFKGIPSNNAMTPPLCSRSSHRSHTKNAMGDFSNLDRNGPRTQGFWPGRYSYIYDNGEGNVVFGCYIPSSGMSTSTYIKFSQGQCGPGTGSTGNFAVVEFFHGIPYYKVFFGHNYNSFLSYLNNLRQDIVLNSLGHEGFFAIGCMMWPAYMVASGPFSLGYAPLRYAGKNREYFVSDLDEKENWPKYWVADTNMPPITNKGRIDYKAKVFCLLRNGLDVMYGSSIEGSLLFRDRSYFCGARTYPTYDDVQTLGRYGPYVQEYFPPEEKKKVINIPLKFKFRFQWGGYHYPGHWLKSEDPRSECKQPPPTIFPDGGSPGRAHRRRRHVTSAGDDAPQHPGEVWASHYEPRLHLSPGGSILPAVLQRLTGYHLSTALGGLDHEKRGKPTGYELCSAYGAAKRARDLQTSESETEAESYEETEPFHIPRRRRREMPSEEAQGAYPLTRPDRATTSGQPECVPCQQARRPLSTRQRVKLQRRRREERLELLNSQYRNLKQLEQQLTFKGGSGRSLSYTDLSSGRFQYL
ncbi:ORF1 [torque teno Delphinidae virus 4]